MENREQNTEQPGGQQKKTGDAGSMVMVLRALLRHPGITQRELAAEARVSLGKLNQTLSEGVARGYLEKAEGKDGISASGSKRTGSREGRGRKSSFSLTESGHAYLARFQVDAAVILAAGFGSRFVPLSFEMPKGLLPVFGERMIERQIRQLQEAGIRDITLMVGYLKEKFDYLIDKYGVKLLYNPEYGEKNTLATLYRARKVLEGRNCYVLASDHWMRENLYHAYEPYAWYAASFIEGETTEWAMRIARDGRIREVQAGGKDAWCMYGPAYFTAEFSAAFLPMLSDYYQKTGTEDFYWEDVLIRNLDKLPPIYALRNPEDTVYEFENLEELRRFDPHYLSHSGSRAMRLISEVLEMPEADIVDIRCLKAGMTNKSFLFSVREDAANSPFQGQSYICRIPGPGTEDFINRREEWEVYQAVGRLGITEQLLYFDAANGYKISRYYQGARNADFSDISDLRACMAMLKTLHNSGIRLGHKFSVREKLRQYEALCLRGGREIPFEDYALIRQEAQEVLAFLDALERPETICHIDSVHDNFLFTGEGLKMIDWEYCGMADPLIDLAMAAIYAYMDFGKARELLGLYQRARGLALPVRQQGNAGTRDQAGEILPGTAPLADPADARGYASEAGAGGHSLLIESRDIACDGQDEELMFMIVVAYMGLSGLLWTLWSVYKISLGENFGDYSLKMYRYFKESYQILRQEGKI